MRLKTTGNSAKLTQVVTVKYICKNLTWSSFWRALLCCSARRSWSAIAPKLSDWSSLAWSILISALTAAASSSACKRPLRTQNHQEHSEWESIHKFLLTHDTPSKVLQDSVNVGPWTVQKMSKANGWKIMSQPCVIRICWTGMIQGSAVSNMLIVLQWKSSTKFYTAKSS